MLGQGMEVGYGPDNILGQVDPSILPPWAKSAGVFYPGAVPFTVSGDAAGLLNLPQGYYTPQPYTPLQPIAVPLGGATSPPWTAPPPGVIPVQGVQSSTGSTPWGWIALLIALAVFIR